jgi:3-hydroxybutyrate dehydrogenase
MIASPTPVSRSALITGSTSGIGLGIATALAEAGFAVTLNGLGDPAEIEGVRSRLAQRTGMDVRYSAADMTRPAEIATMIDEHIAACSTLDVLVNNAGVQHVSPIESFEVAKWDEIISINLSSAFHTTRLAIPEMKQRGWGRVINIASAHGLVASEFKAAYVAAKHGMVGLTKVVALEVARLPITCNAICPGYVQTPLVDSQIDEQARAHGLPRERIIEDVILAKQPNKRFVTVEQIAALVGFLATDVAATINGATLSMDGGWVAQ